MQSSLFEPVYGLVQATVDVGTVLIWDFSVAITSGGDKSQCKIHRKNVKLFKQLIAGCYAKFLTSGRSQSSGI
jgi:hypothetical protein